jgi:hypothetical protein
MEGAQRLVSAMGDYGEDQIVWNPFNASGHVDWWICRIGVETAVHRWDGEDAYAEGSPSTMRSPKDAAVCENAPKWIHVSNTSA